MQRKTNKTKQEAEVAMFTADKVDFNPKMVIRNRGDHYIMMMKGLIHQKNITILNYLCTQHQNT